MNEQQLREHLAKELSKLSLPMLKLFLSLLRAIKEYEETPPK